MIVKPIQFLYVFYMWRQDHATLTVVVGKVVTEANASLLVTDEVVNAHYDILLPSEEKLVRYFWQTVLFFSWASIAENM
jgi:hypothetical protein